MVTRAKLGEMHWHTSHGWHCQPHARGVGAGHPSPPWNQPCEMLDLGFPSHKSTCPSVSGTLSPQSTRGYFTSFLIDTFHGRASFPLHAVLSESVKNLTYSNCSGVFQNDQGLWGPQVIWPSTHRDDGKAILP